MSVLVREVVRPPWPFRLGRASLDGLLRRRGDGLIRLVHVGEEPVVVAMAPSGGCVVFAARAASEAAGRAGIARMRFVVGVDDDLAEFHARFRADAVIGRTVRLHRWLRVRRQPSPWETFMWAITEQLIDLDRAVEIQKLMIRALGGRCPVTRLRDAPTAAAVAAQSPARLESFGLAAKRSLAMWRAAREVASARVDFSPATLARLRAIPEIGPWTIEMTALHGLGRLDVVPAGDLGYLKLVGRLATGHPKAVADEAEVRGFFAAYAPWAGLAGEYLRLAASTGLLRVPAARRPARTRWSAAAPPTAVA